MRRAVFIPVLFASAACAGSTYYVDCAAGDDTSNGLSPSSAWRSVRVVSAHQFRAGDAILLRRGSECTGTLWPKGSGTAAAPIILGAWGIGPLPKVRSEPAAEAAFRLLDQEHWTVEHLEFIGGQPHGMFISGTQGVLHGIHIRDVIVHGVTGEPKNKEGGLVVIAPSGARQRFDDVVVDGVTAYGTSQWAGILVGSVAFGFLPDEARSTNVVIRNSMVHDVAGDGIVLFQVNHGAIENSIAWYTGMQKTQTIGTPNAIWTWMCGQCAVRRCEAFLADSPGVDGGAFDIDYGDDDNVVEDSYGHDTQGYCAAVFGAGRVTTNSLVRRNVCAGNGRSPRLAVSQGAVFLTTWDGGRLKGLQVSDNLIFWDPPIAAPAIVNTAAIDGGTTIENNTIEPRMPPAAPASPARWRLSAFVSDDDDSRGQVALVASAYRQFYSAGLDAVIVAPGAADTDRGRNRVWDWNLGPMILSDGGATRQRLHVSGTPALVLENAAGQIVWRHNGLTAPGDLGLALRSHLGNPDYAKLISEP